MRATLAVAPPPVCSFIEERAALMKAIVLTCDRYRALTAHMIARYAHAWPDHPFRFRVPFQKLPATTSAARVEYRRTPLPIKATVLTLLEDLADERWVYWCIDDKYPVALDLPRLRAMSQWVAGPDMPADISGVAFCRCRGLLDPAHLTGERITDPARHVYLERKDYSQIWLHQFLRVKVLRGLFQGFPDEISQGKLMDKLKDEAIKPPEHRLYVSRRNLAILGESTTSGQLTRNCAESIQREGMPLPEAFAGAHSEKRKLMGRFTVGQQLRLWLIKQLS